MAPWLIDDPIQVGPMHLRGRIYLPAHQPGLADEGKPGERYIAYHRQRARSGVAMQVTGATPIKPSSEWSGICLWNIDDSIVPGYQRLAEAVHSEGGRMLAQLAHPGPTETEGVDVLGPSWDFSEVSRQVAVPATVGQLDEIVELYAAAADRCRRGDLDGVEISMAHGLLLASFLSPLTNHRNDEYGGDFDRRLTLPKRVIDAVRDAIGEKMILGIRLGVDDLVDGGLRPIEAARIAAALQNSVDYISVMVGNNNRLEARVRHWPPTPATPGLFRGVARTIKDAVDIPVCAVGRITTAELANDLLVKEEADLVGMVRAQIADPDLLSKTRSRHSVDIRPCVGANVCVNELLADRPLACLVNPDAGTPHESLETRIVPGSSAVVVGAGPAGLEAARRLSYHGYRVTVFETESVIGGQMRTWITAPSRMEFHKFLDWQLHQLEQFDVDVRLETTATAETMAALSPDIAIIAAGATPAPLNLRCTDGSVEVFTPTSALGQDFAGRCVVVADEVGELDSAWIAERLEAQGAQVTVVTSRMHIGEGEGINTLYPMLRTLSERRIPSIDRMRCVQILDGRVHFAEVFGAGTHSIEADALVTWRGGIPAHPLVFPTEPSAAQTHVIGDALRPRRVLHATRDAKRVVDGLVRAGTPNYAEAVQ
ncbi:NAD(P)-binding protein [Rhodococcus koreensis]|uniref:oxidoreductase n=1 Tax=Rhodococcus koreensis TaxID=99653 RepID=UPI00366F37D2